MHPSGTVFLAPIRVHTLTSHSRSTLITLGPCRGLQPLLFLWVTAWRLTELPRCSSKSQSLITHSAPPGVIKSCRANTVLTEQCQPVPSHTSWLMETNLCRLKECQRDLFRAWYSCQQCNWCLLPFFRYMLKTCSSASWLVVHRFNVFFISLSSYHTWLWTYSIATCSILLMKNTTD